MDNLKPGPFCGGKVKIDNLKPCPFCGGTARDKVDELWNMRTGDA